MEPPARVSLTRDQARFLGLYVAGIDSAASADLEDLGKGHVGVTIYDKEGQVVATRTIQPGENRLE